MSGTPWLPAGRRGALLQADAVRRLAARLEVPVTEVVPGAETVLVQAEDADGLARLLAALPGETLAEAAAEGTGEAEAAGQGLPEVTLQVRYDGPDLHDVADASGLDVAEVVRRHAAGRYTAAFTGFAPGFAYLTGLDPALRLPRRDTPRSAVPAGSLAIADAYTAVYPRRSPGGWHLLGTVETPMFDADRDPPALISPGQAVRFVERS